MIFAIKKFTNPLGTKNVRFGLLLCEAVRTDSIGIKEEEYRQYSVAQRYKNVICALKLLVSGARYARPSNLHNFHLEYSYSNILSYTNTT